MSLQVFQYQNSPVTFNFGSDCWMNATEMARIFNKEPIHYLRNESTKEFINELCFQTAKSQDDYLKVMRGGSTPGTWMHEDVALDFAQWLSPAFRVWCNQQLKKLITTGTASLTDEQKIAQALQISVRISEQYREQNLLLTQSLQQQAPMVNYYLEVLQTEGGLVTSVVAQDFGMSAIAFNRKLKAAGVIRMVGGTWVLCSKYQNKGYETTKTHAITNNRGEKEVKVQLLWTQKGREFLHQFLTPKAVA